MLVRLGELFIDTGTSGVTLFAAQFGGRRLGDSEAFLRCKEEPVSPIGLVYRSLKRVSGHEPPGSNAKLFALLIRSVEGAKSSVSTERHLGVATQSRATLRRRAKGDASRWESPMRRSKVS